MSHLHHKVSALVDGELSSRSRARALSHARGCPECAREIAETLDVKRRLNQLTPATLSFDLLAAMSSIRVVPGGPADDRLAAIRRMLITLGSVSAVVITLAYVVGAPEAPAVRRVAPPVNEYAAEFADSNGVAPLGDPTVEAVSATSASRRTATWPISTNGADHPTTAQATAADSPQAVTLLRRALYAPDHLAFTGVRVVQSYVPGGKQSLSYEVEHVPEQGTVLAPLGAGLGGPDSVFVGPARGSASGLEAQCLSALISAYDVTVSGTRTVDGRRTTLVTASEDGQLQARFWIDDNTGMLLQRALYVGGHLVRWSGYQSFQTRPNLFLTHLPPEVPVPDATALPRRITAALNDKGFTYPSRLLADFRLAFVNRVDQPGGVVHAEYTDGVSTIAVFEEHGSLDQSSLAGFRDVTFRGQQLHVRDGLPLIAVWQSRDTVFTIVTDLPEQLAGELLAHFPHRVDAPSAGVRSRIGHGLAKIVSAVTP